MTKGECHFIRLIEGVVFTWYLTKLRITSLLEDFLYTRFRRFNNIYYRGNFNLVINANLL